MGHHLPASETPFKWRFAGGPMVAKWLGRFVIFQGDPVQYCKETLYFCDFSGEGGSDPCPPYGSAHALTFLLKQLEVKISLVINVKYFYLLL